jgi:hypothetical protein
LTAIAQGFVLRAFHQQAVKLFVDEELSPFVRHGIATSFKTVVVRDFLASNSSLSERCGAQGLFAHNQLILNHVCYLFGCIGSLWLTLLQDEIRGVAIAEGDILVLSIR